jgi:predicted AAA+ superfamily ATPase
MKVSKNELMAILGQFNPWWRGENIPDLPTWKRTAHKEIFSWLENPPTHRALMISGARQVGKTTLILQLIDGLIKQTKIPPANILYATFDHPILKLAGMDAVLEAWREREPKQDGSEFIFLDEAQFIRDWGTWVKHQVDFFKQRQIVFTGSAMPLLQTDQESGVGRWHTIRLSTLSFYEYIQLKELDLPPLPKLHSLKEIFDWSSAEFYRVSEMAAPYVGHFNEYLVKGGFPQTSLLETITQSQRLLREDIIDKALKRDMTALFGVRRVLDLEQTFLYLCMHDSGLLDMMALCNNLSVKRPTAQNFIELLEAAHLIYRLPPFGYGKEVLRARYKIYLADAAIAPAVLLKGKSILEDPIALGVSAETTVFKHLFTRYYQQNVRFTYWRGKKDWEVDIIAEVEGQIIPFEVKYRTQHTTAQKNLQGMLDLCQQKNLDYAYVVTKSINDFGVEKNLQDVKTQILHLPAALLCYWLGEAELTPLKSL